MYCNEQLAVTNSRGQKRLNQTWRRRQCQSCGATFTSLESIDHAKSLAVQGIDKTLTPFQRDKLFVSILKSCEHRPNALEAAAALTDTTIAKIVAELTDGLVSHTKIAEHVLDILRRYDSVAAVHYEAFHRKSLQA